MTIHDERLFTGWAKSGWTAWNGESPEIEFCQFVGLLAKMVDPEIIIETGVGQRYVTRHLPEEPEWLGYESDSQWRSEGCQDAETPGPDQFAVADFVVLDSDPEWRIPELQQWREYGKPGSLAVVHDCGNGHSPNSEHALIRKSVEALGVPGFWLSNPRGGWVGWHP